MDRYFIYSDKNKPILVMNNYKYYKQNVTKKKFINGVVPVNNAKQRRTLKVEVQTLSLMLGR